jgi:ABC-2 type transport system ATP-binding protein
MNATCVAARNLGKSFRILKRQRSTLRAIKSFFKRDPLTRELWALRDLSVTILQGEKVALIGPNGSGKTTLLRLLAGILEPSAGELRVTGSPLALFKFWIGQNTDLPVIDNIYLFGAMCGKGRAVMKPLVPEILDLAGITGLVYTTLQDLSSGQRQRLVLSIVFQAAADFLIFDETLAHVDQKFARECDSFFSCLGSSSRTVIVASHDHAFLRRHCCRGIWLEEGRLRMDGPINDVLDAYHEIR